MKKLSEIHRKFSAFRILVLFLAGVAVSVITVGSLISFHQYKIWGKPLVQEFIGNKRDNDKSQKVLHLQKNTDSGNSPFSGDHSLTGITIQHGIFLLQCVTVHSGNAETATCLQFLTLSCGLRAPPAV